MNSEMNSEKPIDNHDSWLYPIALLCGYILIGILVGLEFGTDIQQARNITILTYILEVALFIGIWIKSKRRSGVNTA